MTIRDVLWDVAVDQYGYVTTADAHNLRINPIELVKLAGRGALERVSQGLYRFPQWPVSDRDHLMEAVLWTRDPQAALSHDTALDVYELSLINPDRIHVTVRRRAQPIRRREQPAAYVLHYQDLKPTQVGWWEHIPTVTPSTAIDQCIASRVRPNLIAQAIDNARARGLIAPETAARQHNALQKDTMNLNDLPTKIRPPASVRAMNQWVRDAERQTGIADRRISLTVA